MNAERKKRFRRYFWIALAVFLLLIFCSNAIFGNLPKRNKHDDLMRIVTSPDGNRYVAVYRHSGGATVCWSVRCYVYGKGIKERCFFRLYHAEDAEITWLDNDRIYLVANVCGEESTWWFESLPEGQDGIVLDLRGEWYDTGDIGGFGRDENGKVFLRKWWKDGD